MTLPDLAAIVKTAAPETLPGILGKLAEAEAIVRMRLATPPAINVPTETETNISVTETARRLGISPSYIYKNAATLPFVIRVGRRVLCSAERFTRWNRARGACWLVCVSVLHCVTECAMPDKRKRRVTTNLLTVRVPDDLRRRLDAAHERYSAIEPSFTRASIVRLALDEGLQNLDQRLRRDLGKILVATERIVAERKKGGAQ